MISKVINVLWTCVRSVVIDLIVKKCYNLDGDYNEEKKAYKILDQLIYIVGYSLVLITVSIIFKKNNLYR